MVQNWSTNWIGDLLSNVSAKGVNLGIKNFLMFMESLELKVLQ